MNRQRTKILIVVFSFFCCSLLLAAQNPEKEKMRGRLEQLFIWRVSDRLQLTPEEETKFTTEYKKLSEERAASSKKMESLLDKLSEAKSGKGEKAKILGEYEEAFKKYTQVQQAEMTVMKRLFDTNRLAEYVLLKREMLHKFRDVISTSNDSSVAKEKLKFKEPEVEEEK